MRPEGYDKVEYGYCMMPDGTGYIANYSVLSDRVTPEMRMWYVRWMNIHSRNLPEGCGNIRYKLWNQVDHLDHGLVDGDFKKGIYTLETLDMGGGEKPIRSVRHNFDVRDYGFPEEKYAELEKAHIGITSCWESFECPGSHLVLSITRPCPLGGVETCSREWIGYKAENGKIIRDLETPILCYVNSILEMCRFIIRWNSSIWQHFCPNCMQNIMICQRMQIKVCPKSICNL